MSDPSRVYLLMLYIEEAERLESVHATLDSAKSAVTAPAVSSWREYSPGMWISSNNVYEIHEHPVCSDPAETEDRTRRSPSTSDG